MFLSDYSKQFFCSMLVHKEAGMQTLFAAERELIYWLLNYYFPPSLLSLAFNQWLRSAGSLQEYAEVQQFSRWSCYIWCVCQLHSRRCCRLYNTNYHLPTWYCTHPPRCRCWKNWSSSVPWNLPFPEYHTEERWDSRDLQGASCLPTWNGCSQGPLLWGFWHNQRNALRRIQTRVGIMETMGGSTSSDNICRAVVVSIGHSSKANDDAVRLGTTHVRKHLGVLEDDL